MSFPKAPIRRFNEAPRDHESQQNANIFKQPPSPSNGRKIESFRPRSSSSGKRPEKDSKDSRKQRELEREIRVLIGERTQKDKRLQALEDDLAKAESKLGALLREKTSLLATVASLEKQLLELRRSNELLKTKCFEEGTQKKMSSLWTEVMKLRHQLNAKKVTFVRQGNMETKMNPAQETLERSKEKAAPQEEQLTTSETQAEEKCDPDKLLESIAELGNVAAQIDDKYTLEVARLEGIIEAKNREIEILQSNLQVKETTFSTQIEELNEKCKMLEQQKEKILSEHGEKEQSVDAEIKQLKEQLNLENQEHHKLKEICKEDSVAMHQKLLTFQEEVAKEREVLERELKETMNEVEKLHIKEDETEKLLKHLEEEAKSQAEKLAQVETKLRRKNAEIKKMVDAHSSAIEKMQEEHNTTKYKLAEITAEFEIYKAHVTEETARLKQEKTTMQEKILEMSKAIHQRTGVVQEVQQAKEEYARMLQDAQTKLALKEEEITRIKESSAEQMVNLEARLEKQSVDFQKQLEWERRTIAEKLEADYKEGIETWRSLYEDLSNKVKPFQQQLDAYEVEKNALLNEHGAAQEELNKINNAYAKLLGHQNQKQKIKHVMKLKEENTQLKQELSRVRSQLAKEKQVREELQDQVNKIQGVKRFDPSKAFQHSAKENVAPRTPFQESKCDPETSKINKHKKSSYFSVYCIFTTQQVTEEKTCCFLLQKKKCTEASETVREKKITDLSHLNCVFICRTF
ncbi:hypothetical protein JRQ81_002416 [Phrynocephalus forsythii]|uniref:Hyaluronan-mediated motility receptor C-terminal domain-containing protein n=1 Tax=Phrynocephalus forsythii TaxID=171643 RepID=A0A9Q0XHY4_9SAUR|nr:hypothetical protein JRQ81_002416 [Phrynocephalus forsythii]